MESSRLKQAEVSLRKWQEKLNLNDWDLHVELTDFTRTDYVQTGDFKVLADKKAVILISKNQTDKDLDKVVLHEIIHVLLWNLDKFCEEKVGEENGKEYLDLLESTVADITGRISLN